MTVTITGAPAASVTGCDSARRTRSHTGSVSRRGASRSSHGQARTSSPATARRSNATNRSCPVAVGWPANTARVTAAKSWVALPSRSLTATSSPSNVVPGATSVKGASSDPRRAVRSVPCRDHPRNSPPVPTSMRSRQPSLCRSPWVSHRPNDIRHVRRTVGRCGLFGLQ